MIIYVIQSINWWILLGTPCCAPGCHGRPPRRPSHPPPKSPLKEQKQINSRSKHLNSKAINHGKSTKSHGKSMENLWKISWKSQCSRWLSLNFPWLRASCRPPRASERLSPTQKTSSFQALRSRPCLLNHLRQLLRGHLQLHVLPLLRLAERHLKVEGNSQSLIILSLHVKNSS